MIRRASDERLTELARGIARRDYLIADASREWVGALMLMAPALAKHSNLGTVLVPVAPHTGGMWVNGKCPAVVLECVPVAKGDLPALERKLTAMHAALYPESEGE